MNKVALNSKIKNSSLYSSTANFFLIPLVQRTIDVAFILFIIKNIIVRLNG